MKKIQLLNLKEGAEINFSANTQNHTNEESDHYMKQTVKASVFEDLFSNKEYLLQLYQALHPEDTTVLESDLEYVTLQQVMANNPYNDLGFKVGSRLMILVEAQSTWTENCQMYYVSGSDLERLFYFFQTKRLRFDEIGISRTRIICSIYWFQNN